MRASKYSEYLFISLLGGALYGLCELLWRGYTHPSMVLTGGICFAFVYHLSHKNLPLYIRALICGGFITLAELLVGVGVNIILKLDVWDYSMQPLNFMGQICILYSFFWVLLSFVALPFCNYIRKTLFTVQERKCNMASEYPFRFHISRKYPRSL